MSQIQQGVFYDEQLVSSISKPAQLTDSGTQASPVLLADYPGLSTKSL